MRGPRPIRGPRPRQKSDSWKLCSTTVAVPHVWLEGVSAATHPFRLKPCPVAMSFPFRRACSVLPLAAAPSSASRWPNSERSFSIGMKVAAYDGSGASNSDRFVVHLASWNGAHEDRLRAVSLPRFAERDALPRSRVEDFIDGRANNAKAADRIFRTRLWRRRTGRISAVARRFAWFTAKGCGRRARTCGGEATVLDGYVGCGLRKDPQPTYLKPPVAPVSGDAAARAIPVETASTSTIRDGAVGPFVARRVVLAGGRFIDR